MTVGFVGRTGELDALAGLARSESRGPRVALVFGEPGCGKSRLLAEAAGLLPFERRFSLVGFEPEQQVPLAAASSLLRDLASLPESGTRLAELLSETPIEPGALQPIRVFEAAHLALGGLEPALLIMDDLQWADELSLALCHYLVRAAVSSGQDMAVVAASRPASSSTSFSDSIEQLVGTTRTMTIELGPLSREEGIELAAALRPNIDAASAAQVWERARGSPFWIEALAGAGGSIDPSALVARRLRGTSGDAGSLLAVLTVGGRPMSVEEIGEVKRWPPERVRSAASELVSRGVVLESGGALRLAHDLLREAALRDLRDEPRRELHRRLAEHLESTSEGDLRRLREALDHRRRGGLPALALALHLARSPRRTMLVRDSLDLLTTILDEADPNDPDSTALEEAVASLAFDLADYHVAFERWAIVAARQTNDADRAIALIRASRAACLAECPQEARGFLARARDLSVKDAVVTLELSTAEAFVETWIGPITPELLAAGRRVAATARALAEAQGGFDRLDARSRKACLDALEEEKTGAIVQGDLREALAACDDITAAARGFDVEIGLGAEVWKQYALMQLGRLAESEVELRRIWLESRRSVIPRIGIEAGYWLLRVLETRARLREAETLATEIGDLAARVGDPVELRRVEHQRRRLRLLGGNWHEAFREIEDAAPAEPYEHQRLQYYAALALFSSRVGGRRFAKAAFEYRDKADADAAVAGCLRCFTERNLEGAEILARAGQVAEARACLASWEANQLQPAMLEALSRRRTEALLTTLEGEPARAVEELEGVRAESEGIDAMLFALWTALDLARVLTDVDRRRSTQVLRETAEQAHLHGAIGLSELAEQRLRALGVRTWKRGSVRPAASGLDALSEREREIARLAASGASNIEIAEAVFLSRKTVERHLSNVFAKVGVRNRTELAALLAPPSSKS